jgi:sulfotransferase
LSNKQYFFISGLPRSGSTLLSSILSQNPKCYANITSGVGPLVDSLLKPDYSGTNHIVTTEHTQKLIKLVFDTVYESIPNEIIFDTNRMWAGHIDILYNAMPNVKIICCVRSICDILNSFETIYRKNPYSIYSQVYGSQYVNVYSRAECLMDWNGVVGYSLNALKQAIHSKYSHSIYLIEYESLVSNTEFEINALYQFLEIENFKHDFTNLPTVNDNGCDAEVNLPGLHDVRPSVNKINNHMLLPDDIIERYSDLEYWRKFYDRNE